MWTEARVRSFITTGLRQMSRRWPPKYETLAEAYIETKKNKKTGRLAKHYKCNACNELFPGSEIQIDHILPVVEVTGFTTWDSFISRLFCGKENLQAICKTCHLVKTKQEKEQRKLNIS
jgi:5-methylcytosine-specific restriction endonuclease McrA